MVVRNLDHVTIAVANAAAAIEFFKLLGFEKQHVTIIDGGTAARYMGMPDMKAQPITLALGRLRATVRDPAASIRSKPPHGSG